MKLSKNTSLKHARKRGRLLIWLPIIGFLAGWYLTVRITAPRYVVKIIAPETEQSATSGTEQGLYGLRAGCYNIAHGRGGTPGTSNFGGGSKADKLERIRKIGRLLKKENLDIVVLNEADFASLWSGHMDQARLIADEAGYPYIVEQRNIDVAIPFLSVRFGNAILSRYPISEAAFLDFPHPSKLEEFLFGGFKDGVVATITLPDGKRIQVAAVHLSLEGEVYRNDSVKMIADFQRKSGLPMIAMGDFNSTAKGFPKYHAGPNGENAIDTLLATPKFRTLPHGLPVEPGDFTFASEDPASVIDWIFVTDHWQIEDKTVIQTKLSDHLPVTVVLEKPQRPRQDPIIQSTR